MSMAHRINALMVPSRLRFVGTVCLLAFAAACCSSTARADGARFDLTGPKVEVRVTRNGVTLPIASVPNLQVGDRLWLHPDLPSTQSVRYLMVLAFLRGTTNPPPDDWFMRVQTWDKKVREEGVEATVPDGAEQAVLFLAPVTGGDFTTLRSAVQGRPGIFVRASQDLAAAGFEQARIEKYIASMRELSPEETSDPKKLQEHSNLIAATLALKPNGDCVKLPPDQQYTCLTQTGSQTLLDDGHGQSIIDALTGSTSQGLIGTVSTTQLAGGGLYSAYVGSIVDLVHIMGSLHTAQYQYIPAIAFPDQQSLNLRLNTPPSFHNPKSVIVIGLPSVQQTIPPPLRAADPKIVSCLLKPDVVLSVEGAPLVFSTGFAHDMVLQLNFPTGAKSSSQDIPLTADAFRGGLVLATVPKRHALPEDQTSPHTAASAPGAAKATHVASDASGAQLTGTVKGYWGFDTFVGPTMPLQNVPGKGWKINAPDSPDDWVIAGKDRHLQLTSSGTACIQGIDLDGAAGKQEKVTWKPTDNPTTVDLTLNIPARDAGPQHLVIHQFHDSKPDTLALASYNEPAKIDSLSFHAGDTAATLIGSSLEQVRQVEIGGLTFKPTARSTPAVQSSGKSELQVELSPVAHQPALPAGDHVTAQIALADGRNISVPITVEEARPTVTLIGHADVPPETQPKSQLGIQLGSQNDLPVNDTLMFSLKSAQPFPRGGTIEVASPDGSLHTTLSLAQVASDQPSLILEDPQTLLGTLQPLKVFGFSAFGPIRLRALNPDGTAGEWIPLVTLVRLPAFTGLTCPLAETAPADVSSHSTKRATDKQPPAEAAPSAASTTPEDQAPSHPPAAPEDATGSAAPDQASTLSSPAAQANLPASNCTLSGSRLYFIDSIATTADFANAVKVPDGFVGSSIAVPPPSGAVYYLRLRDDPATTDTIALPAGPL
jgi:hypothetical protein